MRAILKKKVKLLLLILLLAVAAAIVFYLTWDDIGSELASTNNLSKKNNINIMAKNNRKLEKVRLPAVAGSFYPENAKQLKTLIDGYLSGAELISESGELQAIIVPHAGIAYSGPVVAYSFKQIPLSQFDQAVILGPSHHFPVNGVFSSNADKWQTPLGEIELIKNDLFPINEDYHLPEHSLEIEIPFFQIVFKDKNFKFLPLIVGNLSNDDREVFIKQLDSILDERTLLAVSVDLSHYHPYEEAVKLDQASIDAILSLDESRVDGLEVDSPESIKTLISLAKLRQWRPVLLKYANSGDITSDHSSVVGYSAIGFYANSISGETAKDEYTEAEKAELLKIARTAIGEYLTKEKISEQQNDNLKFFAKRGAFVTLNKNGQLRGCIGYIEPIAPLIEAVRDNAISAAVNDPRFPPLTIGELDDIRIEISILTPPAQTTLEGIEANHDGVVLQQGKKSATYLPQVWESFGGREQFFSSLCAKAGLETDCWTNPETKFFKYQAIVFTEKD